MKKTFLIISMLVVCSMAGTMKDSRDGKTYKTVEIGNQTWMAENLNYKIKGSMCYNDKDGNCKKYGRLYTWEVARNACPSGWHLPSKEELESLLSTVGISAEERSLNLRAGSWKNGANKFGFSALPAGNYHSTYGEDFYNLGGNAYFWSSTGPHSSSGAYTLDIDSYDADFGYKGKDLGYSVRCLQDSNEGGEAQPSSGTLKDSRDGKTYKTVKIGDQVWMAENLNYPIGKSKCYENEPENCEKYGRLYTWDDAKKACPNGWHLPSGGEFETLLATVGASGENQSKNLRAGSWENGANKFGFSALPAGGYYSDFKKFDGLEFDGLDVVANFWSSTEDNGDIAYGLTIFDNYADIYNYGKNDGYSVRCLQD